MTKKKKKITLHDAGQVKIRVLLMSIKVFFRTPMRQIEMMIKRFFFLLKLLSNTPL
jgi:hypothetical protein